jgi:hypothetical protein
MRGIPLVKSWRVTLESGGKVTVLAPTKRLALLNYRFEHGYDPIKSIGLLRKKPVDSTR